MSRPAVFFDRDNTLIVNSEYLGDPDEVELIPGAPEAVARARALGFAIVIVSNQSGVARGMFSEDDVRAVNARMDAMLVEADARAIVDRHEFCATHPQGKVKQYAVDDGRRKPKPGMFLDAAKAMDLDLKRSWLVGDAPRDVAAGHAAGCRTILLRETFRTASPAAAESTTIEADYVASSLLDAIDFIEMNVEGGAKPALITPPPAVPTEAGSPMDPATFADEPVEPSTEEVPEPALADRDDAIVDPPATRTPRQSASIEAEAAAKIASAFGGGNVTRLQVTTQPHVDAPPRPIASDWTSGRTQASSPPAARSPSGIVAEPARGGDRETALLLERVVEELRRANDPPQDFSVARMLAGIVEGFALAAFFAAIVFRESPSFGSILGVALFLQVLVSSLLLMGR